MARMSQSLELLVWSCLFLTVESQQGPVLPPQNVSLLWVTGFQPQLSWAPPQHSGANCTYEVTHEINPSDPRMSTSENLTKQLYVVMGGGFLNMTVATICNGSRSEPAWVSVNNTELVRNLQCYIQSDKQTHCSWQPASRAPDLRFFYWLLNNNFSEDDQTDDQTTVRIQECSTYRSSGGVRTGCDLEANIEHTIHILFNGTVNNTLAVNTFSKDTFNNVQPPPLQWTVNKTLDKFLISWTPPEIDRRWKYIIKYTECGETKTRTVWERTSVELDLVPRCPYRIAIKACVDEGGGETPYSDEKYFDADTDPNVWLYAAIIIPMMLAALAALVLVCCRKNKERIFPKVPEPRDLLSDISDNNNKGPDHNLYVLAEEDDNCKITLVFDPLINKLDF